MRNAITATTATILLIVLAAAVIVGFDVLDVFGERLADSFQPLLSRAALP